MGLTTFSAILDFAIRGEKTGIDFFTAAIEKAPASVRETLGMLKRDAEKNHRMFQTILRENVTEMVMEPYEAIEEARYALDLSGDDALMTSLRIVETQRDFLLRAAAATNLREVKRAFEKIAARKDQLLEEARRPR